jgi:hypothetical protein
MALFQRVRELHLEGIVAKLKFDPHLIDGTTTWFKIRNRAGREDLFERERHAESVSWILARWHASNLALGGLGGRPDLTPFGFAAR